MLSETHNQFSLTRVASSTWRSPKKQILINHTSVQLSTYFGGRMAHVRLGQQVQRELGEKFELGRYHEAVLSHGSLPVKYLPELVQANLCQQKSGACDAGSA